MSKIIEPGVHGGLLDTSEPYAGQAVAIPEEVMFGALPRRAWAGDQDAKLRSPAVVDQSRNDPMHGPNRELLVELGTIVGREGYDYQNPYAWTATGVLAYPNAESGISSGIGGVGLGQTVKEIELNVRATAGVLQV